MAKSKPSSFADAVAAFARANGLQGKLKPSPPRKAKPARTVPTAASKSKARQDWKLVVIDQEPIRREATLAFQKAGRRLAEIRATVDRFTTLDKPSYGNWVAANFADLLTEYRKIAGEIAEKGSMLEAIQMMSVMGGLTPHQAYLEVLKTKKKVEAAEAKRAADGRTENDADDDGDPAGDGDDDDDLDEEDEAMFEEFFEDIFGFPMPPGARGKKTPPPGGDPDEGRSHRPGARRGSARTSRKGAAAPQEKDTGQRLKSAYRAIVRRLHPDINSDLTAYDRQLWYEAQAAYEKGDLERLETILTVSELARGGELPSNSGIGGLLGLTRQLLTSIRQLENQVRGLKREPAWNFAGLVSRDALKQKVEARLRKEVAEVKAELALIEADLAFCQRAPRGQPKRAGPRKKPGRKPPKNG